MEAFIAQTQTLSNAPSSSKQVRDYQRMLASGASDETPDKQGRITIPPHLRAYAGLDKDCVVVGAINRVEVWDADVLGAATPTEQESAFAEMNDEGFPGLVSAGSARAAVTEHSGQAGTDRDRTSAYARLQPVGPTPWHTFPGARWPHEDLGLKPGGTSPLAPESRVDERPSGCVLTVELATTARRTAARPGDAGPDRRAAGSGAGAGLTAGRRRAGPGRLHPRARRARRGAARGLSRGPADRTGPRSAGAGRWPPSGWPRSPTGSTLVEAVYDELPEVLAELGRPRVQGVLLDLGLSSLQIDDPAAASRTPSTPRWTCGWTASRT